MARELDSEMLRRLQEQYREMSDGELLELAAKPDELTDVALEVLRGEMTHRGIKLETNEVPESRHGWASDVVAGGSHESSALPSVILGSAPTLDFAQPESGGVEPGESLLGRFSDAIEVGRACDFLQTAEVPFRLEDVAKSRSGFKGYDSPPVALNLIVTKSDRQRAMSVLREQMGLFPLQEVKEADPVVDDGTVSKLGDFGHREDAEDVAKTLEDARIWHRIVANPDGTVEDENAYRVEVREVDLVGAGDVVEKAMGLSEG